MTAQDRVRARAAAGGYAMVGPSGRTWSVDPATGVPLAPVSDEEHRAVRELLQHEDLDITEPVWMRGADGQDEIVAPICAADPIAADPIAADPIDDARSAVDTIDATDPDTHTDTDTDSDGVPGCGYPRGCCIPADEDGWSR